MKKYIAVIALLAVVTACSVTSSGGAKKPEEASGGLFGLSRTDDIQVDNSDAFKGKQQVIIGSFKVGFIEDKSASAKAGGGYGGRAKANTTLKNVTTEDEQKITDAAYADFKAKLEAAGYVIADRNALLQHEDFKDVNSDPSPYKEEPGLLGGIQVTYVSPQQLGNKIYWHGESGHNGGFAFGMPIVGAGLAADKLKTPVLFVSYIVDFANHEGSGGRFSGYSSVDVGQGISVPAGQSGLTMFGGTQGGTFSANPNGSIKFGQAVYSEETFAEVVNTTSEAAVVGQYALNVATLLMGAGSNQTRSFDFNADPAKYSAVTKKVLADANGKLVTKMKELR